MAPQQQTEAEALMLLKGGEAFARVMTRTGLSLVDVEILARQHRITDPGINSHAPSGPVKIVGRDVRPRPTPPAPAPRPATAPVGQGRPAPVVSLVPPKPAQVTGVAGSGAQGLVVQLRRLVDDVQLVVDRADLTAATRRQVVRAHAAATAALNLAAEDVQTAQLRAELADLEAAAAAKRAELRAATGKPAPAPHKSGAGSVGGVSDKTVRAWAAAHGLNCPRLGRVPAALRDAYLTADGGDPT